MSGQEYETLRLEVSDGIAVLTLNRPDRLNAIDWAMFSELDRAFAQIDNDPLVRVAVLTGEGRAFSAGLDMTLASSLDAMTTPEFYRRQVDGGRTLTRPREMSTPVIAAVNGPASGGGLALALACDVRVASPEAFFNVAFVRIGLSGCDVGVSWLLPRVVGLGHASEMMLTGRRVDAQEAAAMGLVNRVVPAEALLAEALATARLIAANSPFGVTLTKEGLQLAVDTPSLPAALALENRNQVLASRTSDYREAVDAFLGKRLATFTGR
jgi:enoyl-CoA hydratase